MTERSHKPQLRALQILPELRAEQVKRLTAAGDIGALYFNTNYDLSGTQVPARARRVTIFGAVAGVWNSDVEILEVPEPLWLRELARSMLLAGTFVLKQRVTRRNGKVVSYAIENNSIETLISPSGRAPHFVVQVSVWVLGRLCSALLSRIAYGTPGAAATYGDLVDGTSCKSREFIELPSELPSTQDVDPGRDAIFVGDVSERKGIPRLMRAWPLVEEKLEGARLIIVGSGRLLNEVRNWAAQRPDSRIVTPQLPHHDIFDVIASSRVLVAPSVPFGRWREQVGLPIKEALSVGLTVVTTDQTGLAPWLEVHGHAVLPIDASDERFASVLAERLRKPLARAAVRASLPDIDGRREAHAWLYESA